jgi:hypothetical protein
VLSAAQASQASGVGRRRTPDATVFERRSTTAVGTDTGKALMLVTCSGMNSAFGIGLLGPLFYIVGLVILYWVIRLAVRHAIQDADTHRRGQL